MSKFTKGQAVQQIMPAPIQGTVESYGFDSTTGVVTILVTWADADGDMQSRYFTEEQLEAV